MGRGSADQIRGGKLLGCGGEAFDMACGVYDSRFWGFQVLRSSALSFGYLGFPISRCP